jgi:hypothetical protein
MIKRTMAAVMFCALATLIVGCRSGQIRDPDTGSVVVRGAVPSYEVVASGYNARVENLERVEAQVSLTVTAKNDKGERISNQLEGHLNVMLPSSVSLRVNKITQPIFYLGSNEQQYWWIDLTADPKVAMVGRHAKATPEAVSSFGIPVHPLDLIEVLAVRPLPTTGEGGDQARLSWSENGRALVVSLPGRWGERRFSLEPETYDPIRIELLDGAGNTVVSAVHTDFVTAEVVGNVGARPRLSKRIDLTLPAQDATVTVAVYEPRNPGPQMRVQVFNLRTVLQAYNVQKVVDIDNARADNDPPAAMRAAGVGSRQPGAATR